MKKWRGKSGKDVLSGITFTLERGDCVGLVGESGSGKSTLSRLLVGLEKVEKGSIQIEGEKVANWIRKNKGKIGIVFQDYTSSANPRFRVKEIIGEFLQAFGGNKALDEKIAQLLETVELPLSVAERYPHELSGGQLQRVCIARAISTKPQILVLDEAVSSLDVSIQAQILELLNNLKKTMNMTILFISHDIQVVTHLCDKIMFLHKGKIVENIATTKLKNVQHPYAKTLLGTVPQ
ncbi:ABC transporter ATP-binding protein [Lederbergia galactosidilytica]|nr:ABC transporter ATP-binding protein [Lederbergia galactosidilytica]MBP1916803.1 nickel transport system ATP-binding protein [Lederbergia galactosidilytica]